MLPRLPKHRTFYPPTGISEGDFFPGKPGYTVHEFGTGLKFVLFRLFTREFVLLGGLKFVGFRGSRVFTDEF